MRTPALSLVLLLAPAAASAQHTLRNGRFAGDATLAQVANGRLVLKVGHKGEFVKKVQQALLDMGFSMRPYPSRMTGQPVGGVDGAFGGQMTTALRNFQVHAMAFVRGVAPTGWLDAASMKALDELAPSPGKQSWSPGERPKVPVPVWKMGARRVPLRVVVVKAEHRTFLFDRQGALVAIFSNAVGDKANQTDVGIKQVIGKLPQSDAEAVGLRLWRDKRAFGVRIVNLSWYDGRSSGEELHGTFAYDRMGQDVSHGCVRHYNEDIIRIFDALAMRDMVAIVDFINDARLGR